MNAELATIFARYGTRIDASRGASLFAEGDPCRGVPLLEVGCVRVFRSRRGEREGTLYRVRPGDLCLASCLAAIGDEPVIASAAADEAIAGWLVAPPQFRALFEQSEVLRAAVLALTVQRIRALLDLIEETQDRSVDERLASYLLDQARVGPRTAGEGRLDTTHEKVASDLWTAREVVSRALKGLEQRGCVRVERGAIVVLDADLLADVSSRVCRVDENEPLRQVAESRFLPASGRRALARRAPEG